MQAAVCGHGLGHRGLDGVPHRHITGDKDCFTTPSTDGLLDGFPFWHTAGHEGHFRPLARKTVRCGFANATIPASDYRHFIL
jgi:hypothetical protein